MASVERAIDGPLTDSAARGGMNKGEANHALRIGRQGEIRQPPQRGQHYRMAGLNVLTAIVISGIPPISAKQSDSGNTPA